MTYGILVWQQDAEIEHTVVKFPCSKCKGLFKEIHAVTEDIQLCHWCYRDERG